MNLTVLPGGVSYPDGDAVHFDVLHGTANEIIGRLRDLGLEQRGSIVLVLIVGAMVVGPEYGAILSPRSV
jgi:hypothetical protein